MPRAEEDKPIHATPPTRAERIVKWVMRNPGKGSAAALASAALAVIGVLFCANVRANRALTRANTDLSSERTNLANANASLATKTTESEARRKEAETKRDEVLRLSALQDLDDLLAQADALWPADAENITRYERWIGAAHELVADLPLHGRQRDELRAKALPQSAEERQAERASHPQAARLAESEGELQAAADAGAMAKSAALVRAIRAELTRLERERDELAAEVDQRRTWQFPESEREARWWNNQLTKLIEGLQELQRGLLAQDALSAEHGWSLPKRLAFARSIEERSLTGPEAETRWAEALASIRDRDECPAYRGLALAPQLGLLPLGRDPDSGLWEFAHFQTGAPALRGPDGKLVLEEETGLVFVLLPGGTFQMGAQKTDPNGANYDAQAADDEGPVHSVTIAPFFLSKYEMTQGQWLRFAGRNPSQYNPQSYAPSWNSAGDPGDLLHPVEQVSWNDCAILLERMGLELPAEAQWEYGARAGTTTPWCCGNEKESIRNAGNVADRHAKEHDGFAGKLWEDWDDGNTTHARVGSYQPNAFGLHDVIGNVWESCQDFYAPGSTDRSRRGGTFFFPAAVARSAARSYRSPDNPVYDLGLRPAKRITP